MRKDPVLLAGLITFGVVSSALGLAELAYWLYGNQIGIQQFIVVSTTIVATIAALTFAYPWIRQTIRLRSTRAELGSLARIDSLTGLANRKAFFEFSDALFANSRLIDHAILMIDVDDFRSINDSLGYAAADAVLVRIATTIRTAVNRACRGESLIARIAGEEFVALVTYRSSDEVLALADHINADIKQADCQDRRVKATASVGIAFCIPNTTTDAALKVAEDALYRAKKDGPGRSHAIAQGGSRVLTRRVLRAPPHLREPTRAA